MHRASWPTTAELGHAADAADLLPVLAGAGAALSTLRKVKSEAKVSQRTELATATITGAAGLVAAARRAEGDVAAAGRVRQLQWAQDGEAGEAVLRAEAEFAADGA